METLKKKPSETDRNFCGRIIEHLKGSSELKIERCELEKLLSYVEVYKIGNVEFHIIYSNTKDLITLYLGIITGQIKKPVEKQTEIDFTGLICYNKECDMCTKNNLCMSQGKCKICSKKIVNQLLTNQIFRHETF